MTQPRPQAPSLTDGGLIIDLFAGPGGWSTGMRALGIHDIGIEWDSSACATRVPEGHLTIQADVSTVDITPFRGRVNILVASPPCQSWSLAGKQKGKPTAFLDALAGRYDADYLRQLRTDIADQVARRAAWRAQWDEMAQADPSQYFDRSTGSADVLRAPNDGEGAAASPSNRILSTAGRTLCRRLFRLPRRVPVR